MVIKQVFLSTGEPSQDSDPKALSVVLPGDPTRLAGHHQACQHHVTGLNPLSKLKQPNNLQHKKQQLHAEIAHLSGSAGILKGL